MVILGGLGPWWVFMLDLRIILVCAYVALVFLGGLGRQWVFMLDHSAILASA